MDTAVMERYCCVEGARIERKLRDGVVESWLPQTKKMMRHWIVKQIDCVFAAAFQCLQTLHGAELGLRATQSSKQTPNQRYCSK
jgi:hypothetical protein